MRSKARGRNDDHTRAAEEAVLLGAFRQTYEEHSLELIVIHTTRHLILPGLIPYRPRHAGLPHTTPKLLPAKLVHRSGSKRDSATRLPLARCADAMALENFLRVLDRREVQEYLFVEIEFRLQPQVQHAHPVSSETRDILELFVEQKWSPWGQQGAVSCLPHQGPHCSTFAIVAQLNLQAAAVRPRAV
eukprot:scaffold74371_cov69-Phaeocystis_antarctica.AAC.2